MKVLWSEIELCGYGDAHITDCRDFRSWLQNSIEIFVDALNGQRGPFCGRQKRHLRAYHRFWFKLIRIMKIMNKMMIMVITLMIMISSLI